MVRFVNSRRCVHPGISTRWLTEPALSIQELPDFRHAAEGAGLPTNLHYLGGCPPAPPGGNQLTSRPAEPGRLAATGSLVRAVRAHWIEPLSE